MAKRTDSNQAEIVKALRELGASVQCLHTLGRGCPDIAVGWQGVTYLCEIKSGSGTLTPDEARWHLEWKGQVCILRSAKDAWRLLGIVE